MARALNQHRIRDTRRLVILALMLYFCSYGLTSSEGFILPLLEAIGYGCVIVCVLGRLYCLLYIGGRKNQTVIDQGPFSVVRNPLYLCSFIGALGIALMSGRISLLLLVVVGYIVIYARLVQREEAFLRTCFGEAYDDYCARVPRFIPQFGLYRTPDELLIRPRFLVQGARDALPWLIALPSFQAVHYLHAIHWLPALFLLP